MVWRKSLQYNMSCQCVTRGPGSGNISMGPLPVCVMWSDNSENENVALQTPDMEQLTRDQQRCSSVPSLRIILR